MDYLFFNTIALALFAAIIVLTFCAGVFVPTIAKVGAGSVGRFVGFVRHRAGHIASFAAGGVLVALITTTSSEYVLYRWSNIYEAAQVGDVILSDKRIMQTGQIPQHILDWYQGRTSENVD